MTQLACSLLGARTPTYTRREGSNILPVGIELEFENCVNPQRVPYWIFMADGSLRNHGIEYVTDGPLGTRDEIENALRRLYLYVQANRLSISVRTGMHVHVNMQDLPLEQVRSILLAYCLAEPAVYKYVGAHRDINPYCIPWYAATASAVTSIRALSLVLDGPTRAVPRARAMLTNTNKYGGLYAGPLTRLGTIEFRHLLTPRDPDAALAWIDIVQNICAAGMQQDYAALTETRDTEELARETAHRVGLGAYASAYDDVDVCAAIFAALPFYVKNVPESSWIMTALDTVTPAERRPIRRNRDLGLEELVRRARAGRPTPMFQVELEEYPEEEDDEYYDDDEEREEEY